MIKNILLIEDNPDNSILFAYLLTEEGFQVIETVSAEEALVILETQVPDLIISDISLPGMSGNILMQQLRQNPKFKHTCAIALSAFTSFEDKCRTFQSGFNEFIEKPIEATQFADDVKQIYAKHHSKHL